MGGGSPKYNASTMFTGSTGGRQMPGESRSPLHGTRNKASVIRSANVGNEVATTTNMFTVDWQNSVNRLFGGFVALPTGLPNVSGVGGGPNERGTSAGNWRALGNGLYGVNTITVTVGTQTKSDVDTNWTHRIQGGSIVDRESRHIQHNFPYYYWEESSSQTLAYDIRQPTFAGGGGWGASGGDYHVPADTGWLSAVTNYGGAGGPAVKTNGHAVTWVGGQGTDRVFGAIS